ncbi:MAG: TetR/AcrR family transcriptional regulator [Burkholderiaceae bacterium]
MEAPEPPADRAPADTRERILGAARRLFAQRGRDGVTMREVSREARVTAPTIYHHFGDKHRLYAACVASVLAPAAQALRAGLGQAHAPPARPLAFATALCGRLLDDPWLLSYLQLEAVRGAPVMGTLVPEDVLSEVEGALGAAGAGAGGDVLTPARQLVAGALGGAMVLRSAGSAPAAPQVVAALAAQLVRAAQAAAAPR